MKHLFVGLIAIWIFLNFVALAMLAQQMEKPAKLPEPKVIGRGVVGDSHWQGLNVDMTVPKATQREIQRFADRICQDKYRSEYLTEKSYDCL